MGAPTVIVFVGLTLPTASQPPSLSGTASLGSLFKGSCQTEGLTEGSFCTLHSAFCIHISPKLFIVKIIPNIVNIENTLVHTTS